MNKSDTLKAIKERHATLAQRLQEIDHWYNAKLIEKHGYAYFQELKSHRDGTPVVSSYFRDIHGRSPRAKSESMAHSRALRKLQHAGDVELLTAYEGSPQVRWIRIRSTECSPGTKDKHFPAARPQSAPCATYCYPSISSCVGPTMSRNASHF